MSVESHTVDCLAKEFLHLREPVRRAAMEFAGLAEEICRGVASRIELPRSAVDFPV